MKGFTRVLFVVMLLCASGVSAQAEDPRVVQLRDRILDRIPDIPAAERGLGRGDEREAYATRHAEAIVNAADQYSTKWDRFAEEGDWDSFNAEEDLPFLIAAIAYRESAFQPVIRLDDNSHVYSIREMSATVPASVAAGRTGRPRARPRGDMGFMQVRFPGPLATACGASRSEAERLLNDYAFNYQVGTCILTRSLAAHIEDYDTREKRRLRWGQRPNHVLSFFNDNPELSGLVVIERYNWGNRDLYEHRTGSGYAKRVLREFLFFKGEDASST